MHKRRVQFLRSTYPYTTLSGGNVRNSGINTVIRNFRDISRYNETKRQNGLCPVKSLKVDLKGWYDRM